LENLQLMVGGELLIQRDNGGELLLVGTKPTLPEDFAPVVVSDASGRVRSTYELWAKHKDDLELLTGASNSYLKLNVRLWNRSCGKVSLSRPKVQQEVAEAILEAFNRDPKGEWLVISYKDALPALRQAVEDLNAPVPTERLHWINWGRHHSTNAFRDVENVILIGQNTYRSADYLALTLAASGLPIDPKKLPDTSSIRLGEYRHHLLQAVCRGSVRKASGGTAGRCNAYVLTSQGDAQGVLEEVFPGCSLSVWREPEAPFTGKLAAAINFLESVFADPGTTSVNKKAIRDAIGIKSAPSLTENVLSRERFREFLADNWLEDAGKAIRRTVCAFPPVDN
jgi:hypothetical protein